MFSSWLGGSHTVAESRIPRRVCFAALAWNLDTSLLSSPDGELALKLKEHA
jgi:hypothetical protein